jgi:hypothetical protein
VQGLTDGSDGVLFVIIKRLGNRALALVIQPGRTWSPPFSSPRSRSGKPCLCAFSDEVTLKLRERPEDMKDELTPAGRRINILG